MKEEIKAAIAEAKHILLHCHPSPDPDSYGSALGLYHYLKSIGKEVTVIKGDSLVPDFAEFLPGANEILAKNYLEINPSDYDLFIILDSGGPDRISTLGPVVFPSTMKTVLIDHHLTTTNFATISWVDPTYAATAEMLTDLLTNWGVTLSHEAALCLMLGLYTDTGGFKYPITSPRTFRLAALLAERAPNYHELIFRLENNRGPKTITFQALALSSVKTYFGDRVAIAAMSHQDLIKHDLSENDVGGVSVPNILKSVRGWDIGISLIEWEPGVTGASIRTRDAETFDLTKLAKALGGGGHKSAAGAKAPMPINEFLSKLLTELPQAYPQLLDAK